MMNDPISDMLIRIKNGYLARNQVAEMPYSKINEEIAKILVKEGYLKNAKCKMQNSMPTGRQAKCKTLQLTLKYEKGKPVLEEVRRISKPGLRIYTKAKKIPKVKFGFGITIVSTSKGIMTDKQAKNKNLGGEVICQIW